MAYSGSIGFDELGRVINPEEAFYINNPPPAGQQKKPIPEIDVYDHMGDTKLSQAARYKELDEARRLLGAGANPNILNAHGRTPLEIAAANDDLPMAELLLELGAKADIGYPLARSKSEGMAALLKQHGATEAAPPKPKKSIMLWAYSESEELGKILKAEEESGKLNPSVTVAVMLERSPETVKQLIAEGGDINEIHPTFGTPLGQAIRQKHDAAYFAFLLEAGADPNLNNYGYASWPLYSAVSEGHIEAVKLLLKAGAKLQPEGADSDQHVLMRAVKDGNTKIARVLLEAGADPNERIVGRDGDPEVPLLLQSVFYTASKADMVRLLLEAGADPGARDGNGRNALAVVDWYESRLDTVMTLLEFGVSATDPSIHKEKKMTLLHWAIPMGNSELFNAALKAGVDVTQRDRDMDTPLLMAVQRSNPEFVRALLKAGAPVNKSVTYPGQRFSDYSRSYKGRDDMLAQAVQAGNLEIVNILLAAKVDLDTQGNNYNFYTALHLAVKEGRGDIAAALLAAGAKVDVRDRYKRTPLFLAVDKKDLGLVTLLLAAGANPNLKDEDKESALERAEQRARGTGIPELLRGAAGK